VPPRRCLCPSQLGTVSGSLIRQHDDAKPPIRPADEARQHARVQRKRSAQSLVRTLVGRTQSRSGFCPIPHAALKPVQQGKLGVTTMAQGKHPPGPPMTLGNMREQGVQHLIAFCHNDACRHQAIIDVSKYPDDVEVPWFVGLSNAASAGGAGAGSTCGRIGKRSRECRRIGGRPAGSESD
jgi:hypothetical protein